MPVLLFILFSVIGKGSGLMIGDWIKKVEYPQLPAMTEQELASFFEEAQQECHGPDRHDGSPLQRSPGIWYGRTGL
jgi:hypothetical protein